MLDACGQNLYRQQVAPDGERELLSAFGGVGANPEEPCMTSLKSQLAGARPTGHRFRESSRRRRLAAAVSGRVVSRATTAALCLAIFAMTVSACGGGDDGPASFLSADDTSAIFVQWTRTGDDVSGTLSTAEVSQAQAQTELFSTAPAPGQIQQQTGAFTGTVRDDSVRLLIGSGTQTNRVNGRLDGDTLELTIPQDQGVLTRRLKPADDGDYTEAVQQIRDHERQRKAAAKAARVRKQRADKVEITRVATAFQKALSPTSTDDPCRYVTSKLKVNVRGFDFGSGRPTCTRAIRDSDAELSEPVFKAPLGVAEITFGPLPPLTVSFNSGPDGAVVTWRPKPDPDSFTDDGRRTMFIEENGRWLVYRCCP
jgi:hypothetical protein